MFPLLLTASLLVPQAPNGGYLPQNGRALETYSLHGLLGPFQEENMPWPPPMFSFLHHRDEHEPVSALHAVSAVQADTLLELVGGMHRQAYDDGRLALEVRGNTLLVSGERQLTEAVGRDLRQFRALLARPIALEASLYRWTKTEVVPTVLAPDRVQATVNGLERVWHGGTRVRSGQAGELGVEMWSDYVRSADAEVAQEAAIGRPLMDSMFEGTRILIQPHSLVGSEDLVLYCQGAFGQQRGPVSMRATGVPDLPSLDVPVVDMNAGSFSGRIASGGALALTSTGAADAGSRVLLVISARYTAPPANLEASGLRVFPVSALTCWSMQNALALPHPYPPVLEQEHFVSEDEEERGYGSADLDLLTELIQSTRPEEFELEGTDAIECGPYIGVRGSPEVLAAVETLLTGLQDRWLVNTEIELHTKTGEATWHRLAVPALQGRRHVFLRGIESTALRSFHTDIAQDAALYNPEVDTVFSGIAAAFETSPGDNGTFLELQLHLSHVPTPMRRPLEARPGGDLFPAQFRIARFQHRDEMVSGRPMDLGDGPQVGTGDSALRTRQIVTLAKR